METLHAIFSLLLPAGYGGPVQVMEDDEKGALYFEGPAATVTDGVLEALDEAEEGLVRKLSELGALYLDTDTWYVML